MKLFLIRHGQTALNTQGVVHKKDAAEVLDQIGLQQANQLTEACRKHDIQVVYASPEKRALQTAEIIGQELTLEPHVVPDLAERDWGDWSGRPWDEIQSQLKPMSLEERYTFVPPSGESWQDMETRLKHALSEVTSGDKQKIAIVTHGGAL